MSRPPVGNFPSTSSTLTTNNGRGPKPGDKYHGERHRFIEGVPDVRRCGDCGAVWVDPQIGLEESPEAYITELVAVFRQVWRVLAPHGTVWLNVGDSYASASTYNTTNTVNTEAGWKQDGERRPNVRAGQVGSKPKDRLMVPARLALALQADGWWIRSEIVWAKNSPMPESVTDRPTNAHEMIYLLTKNARYFYDRVASLEPYAGTKPSGYQRPERVSGDRGLAERASEVPFSYPADPAQETLDESLEPEAPRGPDGRRMTKIAAPPPGVSRHENYANDIGRERWPHEGRNMRSVWTMATANMKEAHFAVFPEELVRKALRAGCPELVCKVCGTPRRRIMVAGGGWSDCGCATGLAADDFELVESPLGEEVEEDPSMATGRRGLGRERDPDGGTRPITRYEQRRYADQLAALSKGRRRSMETEAGAEAFAHYLRTDPAGARPVPSELLERWIGKGWLERVVVPTPQPGDYRPGVVLDPFLGSGTTALVARKMGLHAVGIEVNAEYADLIKTRLQQQSLFA